MGKNKFVAIDEVASDHRVASVHVAGVPDFHLADIMRGVADAAAARGVDLRAGEIADLAVALGRETFGGYGSADRETPRFTPDASGGPTRFGVDRADLLAEDLEEGTEPVAPPGEGGPGMTVPRSNLWQPDPTDPRDPLDQYLGWRIAHDPSIAASVKELRARQDELDRQRHVFENTNQARHDPNYTPPESGRDPSNTRPMTNQNRAGAPLPEQPADPDAGPSGAASLVARLMRRTAGLARLNHRPSFDSIRPGKSGGKTPGARPGDLGTARLAGGSHLFVGGLADEPARRHGRLSGEQVEKVVRVVRYVPGGGKDPWR